MMKRFNLVAFYFLVVPILLPTGSDLSSALVTNAWGQTADSTAVEEEAPTLWNRITNLFGSSEPEEVEQPVFEKYASVFNYIHQEELSYFDSLRAEGVVDWENFYSPDLIYKELTPNPLLSIDNSTRVFGWHPYWMGDSYQAYPFKLLTHVAFFSYNLDPATGSYSNPDVIETWKATDLVELAHADSCKVLLTVSSHQLNGNRRFFDNIADQQRIFTDSIIALVQLKDADGVDLNFENIPPGYDKKLTEFIRNLGIALKGQGLDLTVSLPKLNRYRDLQRKRVQHRYYEVDTLQQYVDFFVITGYDFYHPYSSTDGPIAPLYTDDGISLSIENVVYNYLEDGLDRKKLVLGLPYYGGVWNSSDDDRKSQNSVFDRHITYREMRSTVQQRAVEYDSISWSAYYVETDTLVGEQVGLGDTALAYTKYWFDDSVTLRKKYQWIVAQDLGGVGIWALGYDNKYPELWDLINSIFTVGNIQAYQQPIRTKLSITELLAKYKLLFVVAGIFLLLFLVIGLVAAIFDWRVREVFFTNKTLRLLYIVSGAVLLLAVLVLFSNESGGLFSANTPLQKMILVSLGIGLGIVLTMIIVKIFEQQRERLP